MHHQPTCSAAQTSATKTTAFFGKGIPTLFFQPKLTVNQPNDAYEQEADAVADQVMRMRDGDAPVVQRMFAPSIQRACAHCEEKQKEEEGVQRKETGSSDAGGQTAPSIVSDVLSSGGGQPMDADTQQFMGSRMGQDFSGVRIHTGAKAAESASVIQARAYTSGRDIVFGKGEYEPSSESGKRLLAHELVHVGQQGGGRRMVQRVNRPACRNGGRLTRGEFLVGLQWLRETGRITAAVERQHAQSIPEGRRDRCRLIERLAGGSIAARSGRSIAPRGHTVDYERLFADNRLDLVIGMGFDEHGFNPTWLQEIHTWSTRWNFTRRANPSNPGIELYTLTRRMTYPLRAGGQQTNNITISFSVITPGVGAARAFLNALNDAEITSYVGHARGGVGPDFDDINSASENVVLGDRTRRHRNGTFRRPSSYRSHVAYGTQNQIEQMSSGRAWHTDRYRVWFFNACTTLNYMDELRGGILPREMGRDNLDLIATRHENPLMTEMSSTLIFLDGVLNGLTIEDITTQMNDHTFNTMHNQSGWTSSSRELRNMYYNDGFRDNPTL